MTEDEYKKELEANGVDVSDLKPGEEKEEVPKTPEEPKKPEAPAEEKKEPEEPKAPLPDEPKEEHKRSIYDEYKEKKAELKSEKEKREEAERERDDYKAKFEAVKSAVTPEEKKEAIDDLEAFAEKVGADPAAIREMKELFQKGQTSLSEDDQKLLTALKADKEKQMFNEEFDALAPSLKEEFPKVTDDELKAIKAELDTIAHSKEWHDKSLDYIAFKNKDKLSALVSPKKRGIEPKSPKDNPALPDDFDPNADLSRMTPAEREKWEETYRGLGKNDGLQIDSQGRKILI